MSIKYRLWTCMISAVLLFLIMPCVFAEDYDPDEYGNRAYGYLQYINDNFPNRINNHEMTDDTTTLRAAGQWICDTVSSFGYDPVVQQQEIAEHDFVNYIFRKKGESEKRIVIGAHYDCVDTHGCEDNGTGVAALMELAKRFRNKATPLTLEFCFFDGEEFRGFAGSNIYIDRCTDLENIALYINLDCLGSGDLMYAYGGVYDESGALTKDWGLQMAFALSEELEIELHAMPEQVTRYKTPTRDFSSDHFYFMESGIPYVYFEANCWVNEDGSVNDETHPYFLNTRNEAFSDTNGQIIHTDHDDLAFLEEHLPGVIRQHLHDYILLTCSMLERAGNYSEDLYQGMLPVEELLKKYAPHVKEPEPESVTVKETEPEIPETETVPKPLETEAPETQEAVTELPFDAADESEVMFRLGDYTLDRPEETMDWILYGILALAFLMIPVSLCLSMKNAVQAGRDPEAVERKSRRKERWKQDNEQNI